MNSEINFKLLYMIILTLVVVITITMINSVRITFLKKNVKKHDDGMHSRKHLYIDSIEMEDMDTDLRKHYKVILARKLIPLFVQYFDKYLEVNGVIKYMNKNQEKLYEIVDLLVARGFEQMKLMKKDEDIDAYLKSIDLDKIIKYIEDAE